MLKQLENDINLDDTVVEIIPGLFEIVIGSEIKGIRVVNEKFILLDDELELDCDPDDIHDYVENEIDWTASITFNTYEELLTYLKETYFIA